MKKKIASYALMLFLLLLMVLVCWRPAHAQEMSNTFYAAQFPGFDAGTKIANAQNSCSPNTALTCTIVIDAILGGWPQGVTPAPCAQCTWIDYRKTGARVFGSMSSTASNAFTSIHTPNFFSRTTTETVQPDHFSPVIVTNYQASGGTNASGKMKPLGIEIDNFFNSIGEHGGVYVNENSSSDGDNVGIESFVYHSGQCPDTGGECAVGLRSQVDGGIGTVFSGTLSTATNNGSTFTLGYSSSTNELTARGVNRWLLRTDGGTYSTGNISSIAGTGTITVTGSGTGWIAGLGTGAHSDLCFTMNTDTTNTGGFKFSTPVTSVTDDTHLVITYQVNATNEGWPSSVTSGAYTIFKCSQISDVSTSGQVIVTNGYTGWAVGQTIESPVGNNAHYGGVESIVAPTQPWSMAFPSYYYRITGNTEWANYGMWGVWADLTAKLSRALVFQNSWACDPSGADCTGVLIDLTSAPGIAINVRDTAHAINIHQQPNQAVTFNADFKFDPVTGLYSFGTTGAGAKFTFDPSTGNAVDSGTLSVGGGSTINKILNGSGTLTFSSIAAQTGQEQNLTITGATTTGVGVNCSPRATLGNVNLSWSSWVSATNTVSVRVVNPTAGAITPSAVAWGCTVNQ